MDSESQAEVFKSCASVGANYQHVDFIHHQWIEKLVHGQSDPFYILDTDCIFYENFERFSFDAPLAGWRIPEWNDEFSGCITRARLHTSLLYIDPLKVRSAIKDYESKIVDTVFTPKVNLFDPLVVPLNSKRYFHDTCSLLYNAIGGQEFTNHHLDSYFHFNFGTISDLVLPRLTTAATMRSARDSVMANPEAGRKAWMAQMEYYEMRKPILTSPGIPEKPINDDNANLARKWNVELCCGNKEAMAFSDVAYKFFHALDDLLDETYEDRPLMSAEQKLEVFILALGYYNHPFYLKHQPMLCATTLTITNMFADSVAWEKSPLKHRRMISNVLSTCGDELYSMIAIICGGWKHARKIGPLIRERDFVNQHTPECERA